MPSTSPAQHKLMEIAAHTLGGYGGVPQSVGKEFVKADGNGRAAGIMFLTADNQTLMMRRGSGGDFPNHFGLPGGHLEDGETLEDGARREAKEETGFDYTGPLEMIHDDGQFATFAARGVEQFPVTICPESAGYVWTDMANPPAPMHPGMSKTLRIAQISTELDVAVLMQDDVLPSPQMYANMGLLAIRITGTGLAYRSALGEHVWRDPAIYLNFEFLARCNGLAVIMDHPDKATLNTKEFAKRVIGSIMLPYIKGDDVWGIAKIHDLDALAQIVEEGNSPEGISTSPAVVFNESAGNTLLTTEAGEKLLIEGKPFLIDHIAIVTKERGSKGVWDKGGEPSGILLTNSEVMEMADQNTASVADAAGVTNDIVLKAITDIASSISGLSARMDSMEKAMPAKELVTAADKKKDDDMKAKADADAAAEEKAKADAAAEEKAKADAEEKAKKDAEGKAEGATGEMKFDEDGEGSEFADAQAKADSVMAAFGKSANRPLKGEGLLSYRKRLLKGLQAFSDQFKSVDLAKITDAQLLTVVENHIFADAMAAAKSPTAYADGELFEVKEKDAAGRTITKYRGSMSAWLNQFKVPALRVTEFKLANNR